jgi:cell division septum initiation protein DivIVA
MLQWLVPVLVVAVIALAFVAGVAIARRGRDASTPEEMLSEARLEAQRILARAEEEAMAVLRLDQLPADEVVSALADLEEIRSVDLVDLESR